MFIRCLFTFVIALIVGLSIQEAGPQRAAARPQVETGKLKSHIEAVMKRIPTSPGVAVAVVKDDRVIFSEGFGYRDLERKLPVAKDTGFYLASTTKSFTAAAAKLLDEQGKLDLDAPIEKVFPDLKLTAPLSEKQISLRDFLTHRAGISNNAIGLRTSYTGQYDSDLLLDLLAEFSEPRSPEYSYTNLGYVLTGVAMEKATGKTWKQLEKELLFDPIGMTNTTSYASEAKSSGNFAKPYRSKEGEFTELPYKNDQTMHAAGGTVSTAEDLAKWVRVMMNDGMLGDKRIISSRAMREILAPQINQDRGFYKYRRYAYNLGWNIATYDGEEFVHCFGTYAGFRPHVSFMPEHKIGVVVLVNESDESIILPDLIANEIYDHLLGKRALDAAENPLIDEYLRNLERERERSRERASSARNENVANSTPPTSLSGFAGKYINREFGEITVSLREGKLFAEMGNLTSYLEHDSGNKFTVDFLVISPRPLEFDSTGTGALVLDGDRYEKR